MSLGRAQVPTGVEMVLTHSFGVSILVTFGANAQNSTTTMTAHGEKLRKGSAHHTYI